MGCGLLELGRGHLLGVLRYVVSCKDVMRTKQTLNMKILCFELDHKLAEETVGKGSTSPDVCPRASHTFFFVVHRWEQPGQRCVPWLTVDGSTIQEWKDRVTVAMTRIRQLKYEH